MSYKFRERIRDNLSLCLVLGPELDELLGRVAEVLCRHEDAEDLAPDVGVHPHLPCQGEQLVAKLLGLCSCLVVGRFPLCPDQVSCECGANNPPSAS